MPHNTLNDYRSCLEAGMSLTATAKQFNVGRSVVASYAKRHGIDYITKLGEREIFVKPRSYMDNILKTVFRKAVGYCPFYDERSEE